MIHYFDPPSFCSHNKMSQPPGEKCVFVGQLGSRQGTKAQCSEPSIIISTRRLKCHRICFRRINKILGNLFLFQSPWLMEIIISSMYLQPPTPINNLVGSMYFISHSLIQKVWKQVSSRAHLQDYESGQLFGFLLMQSWFLLFYFTVSDLAVTYSPLDTEAVPDFSMFTAYP